MVESPSVEDIGSKCGVSMKTSPSGENDADGAA